MGLVRKSDGSKDYHPDARAQVEQLLEQAEQRNPELWGVEVSAEHYGYGCIEVRNHSKCCH